ncbi:uncharacterized protein LOC116250880 [Nymphaea colorata]|uniref:Uncharacterized protein n=1 Tax=Nymphaea colorata TaxID=210225 RepID=A0A5K0W2R0_9MAGN|nr:uncharacterized protein LOC116250880 [Nymphaea colorata]
MGSMLSSPNSNPLISIFVCFHLLVLLYAPHLFLRLLFSPVLICTGVLLAGILHLGATKKQKQLESTTARQKQIESTTKKQELLESTTQKQKQLESPKSAVEIEDKECEKEEAREDRECEKEEAREDRECEKEEARQDRECEKEEARQDREFEKEDAPEEREYEKEEEREPEVVYQQERRFSDIFVEWHRRAPLEVIYEDSEGEKDEEAGDRPERPPAARERVEACSLSLCYPDSDSDSSSDDGFPVIDEWEHPENRYFRWEEEKDDGLIEIPIFLGGDRCRSEGRGPGFFPADEDNLIEIDLFHQTVVKRPDFPARIQAAT